MTADARVEFADTFKANAELFSLHENGYSVSMTLMCGSTSADRSEVQTEQMSSAAKPTVSNAKERAEMFADNKVITKEITSADADVSSADTFLIEWDGRGFFIQPYGSPYVISKPIGMNIDLISAGKSYGDLDCHWNFVQYTGTHKKGATVYRPVNLYPGKTVQLTPVV